MQYQYFTTNTNRLPVSPLCTQLQDEDRRGSGRSSEGERDSDAGSAQDRQEQEQRQQEEEDIQAAARKANISLLDQHTELKKKAEGTFVTGAVV